MQASLALLAEMVQGRLAGDEDLVVSAAVPLADAAAGDITFVDAVERVPQLERSQATAAVVPSGVQCAGRHLIEVADVHLAFTAIHKYLHPPRAQPRVGIGPVAHVSPAARLGVDVDVHPGATIGDDVEIGQGSTIHSGVRLLPGCKIGCYVTIFPNAVLYEGTVVGDHAIIHAGTVIGAYGFGYHAVDGRHERAAQLGNVVIEAHVEIGANATIDRGAYGATRICEGSKLDNQVQIGHNCRIGRHNLICSQVGMAGSTTTGDYVAMAGQVGIRDHVHIGDGVQLGVKTGIHRNVEAGEKLLGYPGVPVRQAWEQVAMVAKLPELNRQIKRLTKAVEQLQGTDKKGREAA